MTIVQVASFGLKDGIKTFRVHGDKKDLEKIIDECRKENAIFSEKPEISYMGRRMWTVLLKIRLAEKISEVG